MAAALPERVEPHPGAQVADFPWAQARTAIAALNDAASTLGSQLDSRTGMVQTISDWEGTFRTEFNGGLTRITNVATGLKETLMTLAGSIVSGAEDANTAQRTCNNEAVQRENASEGAEQPTGGPR